ncbi:hypothetical protein [Streptomyces aureus]|uniref:hypothetical protein n=1 Tax=Streptomyces aureus TaxID=193461 RepID=UPI0006E2111E|nr:hypothetical protein [Streptomyces aureus]
MTTAVGLRLGDDLAWVELAPDQEGPDRWRVTADWDSAFTADFDAHLSAEEVAVFADALLAGADGDGSFLLEVTASRSNPLRLQSVPAGDCHAFLVRLTPNGHDAVVHLDLEIAPMDRAELRGRIEEFRRSLV